MTDNLHEKKEECCCSCGSHKDNAGKDDSTKEAKKEVSDEINKCIKECKDSTDEYKKKIAELTDTCKRIQADYENYRKRRQWPRSLDRFSCF